MLSMKKNDRLSEYKCRLKSRGHF